MLQARATLIRHCLSGLVFATRGTRYEPIACFTIHSASEVLLLDCPSTSNRCDSSFLLPVLVLQNLILVFLL